MLQGLHPIRVEFFWRPAAFSTGTLSRPPGIKVSYTGFDTLGFFQDLGRDGGGRITTYEYDCELRHRSYIYIIKDDIIHTYIHIYIR